MLNYETEIRRIADATHGDWSAVWQAAGQSKLLAHRAYVISESAHADAYVKRENAWPETVNCIANDVFALCPALCLDCDTPIERGHSLCDDCATANFLACHPAD